MRSLAAFALAACASAAQWCAFYFVFRLPPSEGKAVCRIYLKKTRIPLASVIVFCFLARADGLAPDTNIPGQINLFKMTGTGQQTAGAAGALFEKGGGERVHFLLCACLS